jgi:hypothetical protein
MMNAVTYVGDCAPRTALSESTKAEKSTHLFARFMAALMESRRQQALRLIETHTDLLPNDSDRKAMKHYLIERGIPNVRSLNRALAQKTASD